MKFFTSVFLTLFFGLISLQTFAQKKITGEILSETDKTKLSNASVMLLQAKDSILVDFARVNQDGKFSINNPDTADYLLIVSYPKFGEYFQNIKKGTGDLALGQISLQSAASLIEEVLVTGKIPVVVKGDTVEYDASSFATEKNAKVEDLLKVLPGISVDASGKITAQGKTVEKVLVDGEEFFGDDPTLVTRNIRSDMVDKVQVYEKKTEAAERTGVDDGTRVQTINVKLKEEAKNGMFGKAEAGGGTDGDNGFYLGKLALNRFKGSTKISAFGVGANDGTISLGWEDEEKFGMGDGGIEVMEDGGVNFSFGGDAFSNWNGKGQPKALTGGVSYMDAWKDKKHKLNLSYKYGQIENNFSDNFIRETPTEGGYLNSNTTNNNQTDANRHRFNTKYDYAIDSLTALTLKVSGSREKNTNSLMVNGETFQDGTKVSDNSSEQRGETTTQNVSYDAYLTRKFKKEGRSLALRFAGNNSEDEGDLLLESENNNYALGTSQVIDQLKNKTSNSDNIVSSVTYTEPLGKLFRTSFNYEFASSKTHAIVNSFNKDASGGYTVLDDEFSNDFNFNTTRNSGGIGFGYKTEKIDVYLNNVLRHDDLSQMNNYANTGLSRDYLTYNPNAYLRYNISKSKRINLNYSYRNSLPSLFQIQPLRQNTDQMNEYFGNENLVPSKSSSFGLGFNSWDMMKGKYIYLWANAGQTIDAIQTNVVIEKGGLRKLYYENMDKNSTNVSVYGGAGFDLIRKWQLKSNFNLNASYNRYYNYINDRTIANPSDEFAENVNDNFNYGLSIGFERNTTKKVDFNWTFTPGFRTLKTSLNPERNSDGFTFNSDLTVKAYLPWKITLYGEGTYDYEAPTDALPERFERILFKPGISKKFLKSEGLILDFYVNDVFNQNKGFSRSQYNGAITQNTYNTISRYYMLKLTWEFTKMIGVN
ncbi:outer membrane beta-barrel protein [Sphingobacterium sp. CZ-2]|uniref:outer membrane beta-barrel protein n=1 Tax=Sphingobacterium sp. CZ-2 TaxID=2557994 RepID=UPI00106FC18A|nr:outer membrane beta-barrel protein [Sphingobacterium sp. CZ-2]QBR12271.1 hypothetical protein E3D81_08895 [Sphingobacterium sp. CZ-2]